jgi:small membrane protein
MNPIQILIITFALWAIVKTITQFKKGALTIAWLFFWIFFWLAAGIVAVLPQTTDIIASLVGVGRGADLVIYASLLALFYLVFRVYVKIEKTEREITRLVRKLALDDLSNDQEK